MLSYLRIRRSNSAGHVTLAYQGILIQVLYYIVRLCGQPLFGHSSIVTATCVAPGSRPKPGMSTSPTSQTPTMTKHLYIAITDQLMSLGCPPLPVELVEIIIEEHNDDITFLTACSLVCHSWSAIARRHRFSKVITGPRSTSLLCDSTSTVLPYIRYLHLSGGSLAWHPWVAVSKLSKGPEQCLDDILQKVRFEDLTSLESLRIDDVMWPALCGRSRCVLQYFCRRVTSLKMTYSFHGGNLSPPPMSCSSVAQLLGAATSLQHFTLSDAVCFGPDRRIVNVDANTQVSWPEVSMLESLEVTDDSAWYLSRLPTLFTTVKLRRLTLQGFEEDCVIPLITFLKSCTTTLESLSLGLSPCKDGIAEGVFLLCLHPGVMLSLNTS